VKSGESVRWLAFRSIDRSRSRDRKSRVLYPNAVAGRDLGLSREKRSDRGRHSRAVVIRVQVQRTRTVDLGLRRRDMGSKP
jgi:hypothetical protein